MLNQNVHIGWGVIKNVSLILKEINPTKVFLVSGKNSFNDSGAEKSLKQILKKFDVFQFNEFEPNPKLSDLLKGIQYFNHCRAEVILAVGGGTAIDMAKLIRILVAQNRSPVEVIHHQDYILYRGVPIIAVPTTAGSGSEATQFAVVYCEKEKFSVAHPYVLPEYAIVDSKLSMSMSPRLTAVSGIDAISQAVESLWSVQSSKDSIFAARIALKKGLENIESAVNAPTKSSRIEMSRSAHYAGRAINISKTTAPHALSYSMTSCFGVPHGQAVGLTLGEFIIFNSLVSNADVADPRGEKHVRETINHICSLLSASDEFDARKRIRNLMKKIGLAISLKEVGINLQRDRDKIADMSNSIRLKNNPRQVSRHDIKSILDSIA